MLSETAIVRRKKEIYGKVADFPVVQLITNPQFTPAATLRRVDSCRGNTMKFIETYGVSGHANFNSCHYKIDEVSDRVGIWQILGSRDWAKTWFAKWKLLRFIAYQEKEYIGISSEFLDLAEKHINTLEMICTDVKRYEYLANDFQLVNSFGKAPGENAIKINDVILEAYSHRHTPRGDQGAGDGFGRPDFILVDDMESYSSSKNMVLNKEKEQAIRKDTFLAMQTEKRTILWLGNYLRKFCAAGLYRAEFPERSFLFPCYDEKGNSTWQGVRSKADIEETRRSVGELVFQTEMMQNPIDGDGIYTEKMINYVAFNEIPELVAVIQYHDPAFSVKGCYKACITLGKDANDFEYLLGIILTREPYPVLLPLIYEDYKSHSVQFFYYENDGDQWDLKVRDHWIQFKDRDQMRIGADIADGNKIQRIDAKLQVFTYGGILVNKQLENSESMRLFIAEFLSFPNGYFDGLDAFAGARKKLKSFTQSKRMHSPKAARPFFE